MRVAILANNANSFVKPTAQGLQRMLAQIGLQSTVFYHGLSSITARSRMSADRALHTRVKGIVKYVLQEYRFYHLLWQLRQYDVIVVVNHLPSSFKKDTPRDAEIRKFLPHIPIVLYDLAYLPAHGPWAKWLLEGNPKVGVAREMNRGLERYDWYLVASVVSEFPMPENYQMYSLIGVNIDDESLIPQENEEFTALIDFERTAHMKERSVQISALEETHTKYIVLQGEYPLEEIRKLYRRCHIYLLPTERVLVSLFVNSRHVGLIFSRHMRSGAPHTGLRKTYLFKGQESYPRTLSCTITTKTGLLSG